jgi:hypothetical protein
MAQTKKRATPKRSSKPQAKSRGSTKKSRSSSAKSRPASSKSRPASKRRTPASKARSSNGATAQLDSARHTVEDKAKSAGQTVGQASSKAGRTVGKAAGKAKVPLIAGGAALAGAAGGLALASRQDRHRRLAASMRKPRIKLTSHDVSKAAKEVGNFGAQVGELAAELQRNREAANGGGNGKHRSPIEVVLEGLTSRR